MTETHASTTAFTRQLFVNVPVQDLDRSRSFFSALGFDFDPRFSDDKALCMLISDAISVMLLREDFFRTFTDREPCDTSTHTEALLALSCPSRSAVEETVEKALAAGGSPAQEPMDHGPMFGWSFYDPDDHHWEVLWMDPEAFSPSGTAG